MAMAARDQVQGAQQQAASEWCCEAHWMPSKWLSSTWVDHHCCQKIWHDMLHNIKTTGAGWINVHA